MRSFILLMMVAVIVAGIAAYVVRSSVPTPVTTTASTPVNTVKILVAQNKISAGSFVDASKDLVWSEWPADKVQSPPYIAQAEGVAEAFNGAVASRTILVGEPITGGMLIKSGEGGFMSAVLRPGMRAVSVAVDSTTGNAGFIFPGDHVDLILTHAIAGEEGAQRHISETFVEDTRVLAVDQMLDNPENKAVLAKTVTLEVSPHQAEAVNVAVSMGKIALSLRSLAVGKPESKPVADVVKEVTPSQKPKAQTNAKMGVADFYPPEATIQTKEFTRDSDISHAMDEGADGGKKRVRLIRGNESTDIEF